MTRTPGGGKAMYLAGKKLQEENQALKSQLREAVGHIKQLRDKLDDYAQEDEMVSCDGAGIYGKNASEYTKPFTDAADAFLSQHADLVRDLADESQAGN